MSFQDDEYDEMELGLTEDIFSEPLPAPVMAPREEEEMKPINEGDFFRLIRDSQGVAATHHTMVAVRDQQGDTVIGLFLISGSGTAYESYTVSRDGGGHLYLHREDCKKL